MSTEQNKALVHRFYDEVFNARNVALADEFVTSDMVNHGAPPGMVTGPEGIRQVVAMLANAFPDNIHSINDMIAEGDKVVWRGTLDGTHQGAFMGIPPTGKHFTQQQMHVLRVVDDKIAEHWAVRDELSMLQQLGVMLRP